VGFSVLKKLFLAAALAALCVHAPAQAAITVFTDQASFLAAVSNPGVDTFADLQETSYGASMNRSAGTYGYTVGAVNLLFPGADAGNIFMSTNNRLDALTFGGFGAGVSAVGGRFFASNTAGDYSATPSITLSMTDADGVFTHTLLNPTTNSFLGFVSTGGLSQFSVMTPNASNLWPSVDDFTLAGTLSAVPEPATWAMMIVGFGLAGTMLRRAPNRRAFA